MKKKKGKKEKEVDFFKIFVVQYKYMLEVFVMSLVILIIDSVIIRWIDF